MAFFVVTSGTEVERLTKAYMEKGQYVQAHSLAAIALEAAEGFAELTHQQIRSEWGVPDKEGTTTEDLFKLHYTGKRYSFGYPACPRLEDQEQLFRLLDVSTNLDVELTEGFMMDPESSVSALVFHHPDAKYFNLSETDIERLEQLLSK